MPRRPDADRAKVAASGRRGWQKLRRAAGGGEAGVALVEFAFVVPILLLLLLGVLDFGRGINYVNAATHLSNEGARWAVVNRNPGSGSLQQYIRDQADTQELQNISTVCIEFPDGTDVGDPVKVTVSVDFAFLPFIGNRIGAANWPLKGSSTMRLEQPPTNYSAGCA